jgi:phenylacetate-CoA ligase
MDLAPRELEEFRLERLRKIVKHAYENVEMYHQKYRRAGVRPEDLRTRADLAKFPIVTKDDLRRHFPDGILARQYKAENCHLLGTSGSTGTPVKVYCDLDKALVDFALSLPRYMAGKPHVSVLAAARDFILRRNVTHLSIQVDAPGAYETLHGRVFWSMKHTVVNSLEPPDVHITAINRKRPKYIYSYPSTIRNICITAKARGIVMHRPELIMVSGEVLDHHLRRLVEQTFGSAFLNVYGAIEVGFIACECLRQEGLHSFDCKVVVELLNEDGLEVPAGERGRVVITDLFNKATPIIRYAGLGDYAVRKRGPCSCGIHLPLLARVEGRMVDSVILPDGQIVQPYSLTLALEDVPHLSKFQIRQEQPDHIRVLLVKDKTNEAMRVSYARDSDVGRKITDRFRRVLKDQVKIDLVTLDDIPRRPGSHKYATVVSAVKPE